ncbi:hypothetical protein [Sandaracinus amylolyticus]|nr:hypothetical protein [Sandaracinus amylolyticus]
MRTWRSKGLLLGALVCLGCVASSEGASTEGASSEGASSSESLTFVAATSDGGLTGPGTITAPDEVECVEPEEGDPPSDWIAAAPLPPPDLRELVARGERGEAVLVGPAPARRRTVRLAESVQAQDEDGTITTRSALVVGGTRIVIGSTATRVTSTTRTLDPGRTPLDDVDVVRTVALEGTTRRIERVALAQRSTGIVLDELDLIADLDPCESEAFDDLDHVFPAEMPPVRFPPMSDCHQDECVTIKRSWIQAHHHVWMVHRAIEALNAASPGVRAQAWALRGERGDGTRLSARDSSFANWFGEYDADRFGAVRQAINHLWRTFSTGEHGLVTLRHRCPHQPQNGGNACFTAIGNPSAHHSVLGYVNYCPTYFDNGDLAQVETTIHEPLHHVFVELGGILRSIRDRHSHWHGNLCIADLQNGAQYGTAAAEHLAQYEADDGGDCSHRSKAVRNVSNYDGFIRHFGDAFWRGDMVRWPSWPPPPPPPEPTPQPPAPGSCTLGEEGCQCADAVYDDVPDGDSEIGMTCSDHDGEMSCAATEFGVQVVGICTRCEGFERAGGCECTDTEQCAPGLFCFGTDTHGIGGTGHCYPQDPPSWACLADCQRLFDDDHATCLQDHPTGGRCIDSLCSALEAEQCFQQGLVCRDGDCVDECDADQDCVELGYPSETFHCESNECRRAI